VSTGVAPAVHSLPFVAATPVKAMISGPQVLLLVLVFISVASNCVSVAVGRWSGVSLWTQPQERCCRVENLVNSKKTKKTNRQKPIRGFCMIRFFKKSGKASARLHTFFFQKNGAIGGCPATCRYDQHLLR
jgi:hypothetical protein